MQRKMVIKCASAGLILCLGMSLAAGCSGKERTVDYNIEGEIENIQSNGTAGKTDLKQFATSAKWEDEWTAVNTKNNTVQVAVEADISIPDTEQMPVVAVKEPEFDAGYKKNLAESLFEGEDIYYNDISHLPKKELEEKRAACRKKYDMYAGTDEAQKEEMESELSRYDEALETAEDTYTPVGIYDVGEYLGKCGGIDYELNFGESERCYDAWSRFIECRGKEISLAVKDIRQICPKGLSEAENMVYWASRADAQAENQCAISAEEAQKLAQDFMDKLDLDYPVCTSYLPLTWAEAINEYQVESSRIVDGYVFSFDAGIEDVSFVEYGTQENYGTFQKKKDSEESRYFMKARMEVFVTEKGVIEMHAYNPLEITGISESVGFVPLDDIKEIMKAKVTENIGFFRLKYTGTNYMQFNDMELIYFRICDKENPGHYSYVPAWRLSEVYGREKKDLPWEGHDSYWIELASPVLINAIDGSVINFFDEV